MSELRIFASTLTFFTRIPFPVQYRFSAEEMRQCSKYLPVVGIIVGLSSALTYEAASLILPKTVAVLFSMVASVLITGAFHEDGLADVCDGFGGGWTKDKILLIMKDSRVGTYGIAGLLFALATKFACTVELSHARVSGILIISHTLSRFAPLLLIQTLPYSREDSSSKSKGAISRLSFISVLLAFVVTLFSILLIQWRFVVLFVPVVLVAVFMGRYFKRWIGGYTGDCLGAVQQISEIAILICALILFRFWS